MLGVATESGGLVVRECRGVYEVVDMLVITDAREVRVRGEMESFASV